MLTILAVCALLASLATRGLIAFLPGLSRTSLPQHTWALSLVQSPTSGGGKITVLDLATGMHRPLGGGFTSADAQVGEAHVVALAVSPRGDQLAYTVQDAGGDASAVWVASLTAASSGGPQLGAESPHGVLASCYACLGPLAYSPDGASLLTIRDGMILGVNTLTREPRVFASPPGGIQAFACSPSGRWLAYAAASDAPSRIDLVASQNCLPTDGATIRASLVASDAALRLSDLAWSRDEHSLAFAYGAGFGVGRGTWHVMTIPLASLLGEHAPATTAQAQQASPSNCVQPVWVATPTSSGSLIFSCTRDTAAGEGGAVLRGAHQGDQAIAGLATLAADLPPDTWVSDLVPVPRSAGNG
jgi:hypothetical protein